MRRFVISLAALAGLGLLGGCAEIEKIRQTVVATQQATEIAAQKVLTPSVVLVAASTFDAVEGTATNYLESCPCAGGSRGRPGLCADIGGTRSKPGLCAPADAVEAAIGDSIDAGIVVRKKLVKAIRDAKGGSIPLTADWETLKGATALMREVLSKYGVALPGGL